MSMKNMKLNKIALSTFLFSLVVTIVMSQSVIFSLISAMAQETKPTETAKTEVTKKEETKVTAAAAKKYDPTATTMAAIKARKVKPNDWPQWGGWNGRNNTPEGKRNCHRVGCRIGKKHFVVCKTRLSNLWQSCYRKWKNFRRNQ